jgi:hypothetical protein
MPPTTRRRSLLTAVAAVVAAVSVGVTQANANTARHDVSGTVRVTLRTSAPSGGASTTLSPPNSPGSVIQGPAGSGTFSITGAIHDVGSFAAVPLPPPAPGSPPPAWLMYKLTGKQGQVRLAISSPGALITNGNSSTGPSNTSKNGGSSTATWRILSGTGAYAHLRGSGTGTRTHQLIALRGRVHST